MLSNRKLKLPSNDFSQISSAPKMCSPMLEHALENNNGESRPDPKTDTKSRMDLRRGYHQTDLRAIMLLQDNTIKTTHTNLMSPEETISHTLMIRTRESKSSRQIVIRRPIWAKDSNMRATLRVRVTHATQVLHPSPSHKTREMCSNGSLLLEIKGVTADSTSQMRGKSM